MAYSSPVPWHTITPGRMGDMGRYCSKAGMLKTDNFLLRILKGNDPSINSHTADNFLDKQKTKTSPRLHVQIPYQGHRYLTMP